MANIELRTEALEHFQDAFQLLNAFGTRTVGVDKDVMAQDDELLWTELDYDNVGNGVLVDGEVTVWGRTALTPMKLKLDKDLGIAFRVRQTESETTKRFSQQFKAEVANKTHILEGYVFDEMKSVAVAVGGTALSPTDASTDALGVKVLKTMEAKCVRSNVPLDLCGAVASPETIGQLNLSRLMTKIDSYSSFENYVGHYGRLALFYWNGIEAVNGVEPIYFGYKNSIITGTLIDNIITKEPDIDFPDSQRCSGIFVAGVKAIKPLLFKTFVTFEPGTVVSG